MPDTAGTVAVQQILPISLYRRVVDRVMTAAAFATVLLVLAPLIAIFGYLLYKGVQSVNWAFLTQIPKPEGEAGGGMANGIVGSMIILSVASLIGVPFGVGAGIYLAEFGRNRLGSAIRFTADVLNGVPSIVTGIVAYAILVRRSGFSALAGGVALAIMMVPTITRTTEEMLLLVPQALREAAYGLGVSRWRTTLSITLRTATSGVITGVMLAFARVAGETAPLLFTALGNEFWSGRLPWDSHWHRQPWTVGLNQPTAALPLQIFKYATSPYDDLHRQAWAGALVLIILIVTAVSAVRYAVRRGSFGAA
jgi:phosphate transport system permease protein